MCHVKVCGNGKANENSVSRAFEDLGAGEMASEDESPGWRFQRQVEGKNRFIPKITRP